MRPGLAAAVSHWKGDWESERRTALAMAVQRRAAARFGTAEQEMESMKAKAEADLVAAKAREKTALEKQRVQMMGTTEERLEFEKEEQKALRVEYLYKQSARRILNQELIRGWTAWYAEWYDASREKRIMSGAAARLGKPQLVSSFKWWGHFASHSKRQKMSGGWEQKLQMVQKAGEQLLKQERRAAAERRLELQAVIRDLERQINALGREVGKGPARSPPRMAFSPLAVHDGRLALLSPSGRCPIAFRLPSRCRRPTRSLSCSSTCSPSASPTQTRREAPTPTPASHAWTTTGE